MLIELIQIAERLGQSVQLYNQLAAAAAAAASNSQNQLQQQHSSNLIDQSPEPINSRNHNDTTSVVSTEISAYNNNQTIDVKRGRNYPRFEPELAINLHQVDNNMKQQSQITQCKPLDLSVQRTSSNDNPRHKRNHLKRSLSCSQHYQKPQQQQAPTDIIKRELIQQQNQPTTTKLFISSSTSPLYAQASSCTTSASAFSSSASSTCSSNCTSSDRSPGVASEAPSASGSCLSEVVAADSKNSSEFVGSTVSSTRSIHYTKAKSSSRSRSPSSSTCSNTTPPADVTGQRRARKIIKRRSKKVVVNGEVDYNNNNNEKQNTTDRDNQILKAHQCLHCGRSFARSDMLTRHSRLHSGLKPYKCNRCNQIFSRSDHLSTHERTHTGEKPYQCRLCPYSACRRDMITRHMRTHNLNGKSSSKSKKNILYNDEFKLMGDDLNNNSDNNMEVNQHHMSLG